MESGRNDCVIHGIHPHTKSTVAVIFADGHNGNNIKFHIIIQVNAADALNRLCYLLFRHSKPLSQGGTNEYSNLMALCKSCQESDLPPLYKKSHRSQLSPPFTSFKRYKILYFELAY
jgi:5-methylcytosine-specific restriction endonuclease McrA